MNEEEDNNAYVSESETVSSKKRIIQNDNMKEDEDDNAYVTESETVTLVIRKELLQMII